jgi:hypothetical protein
LTALFDSSFSESALDLPYTYTYTGQLKDNTSKVMNTALTKASIQAATGGLIGAAFSLGQGLWQQSQDKAKVRRAQETKTTQAEVIMLSSCKEGQVAADMAFADLTTTGALSHVFIQCLTAQPSLTYIQLLLVMKQTMLSLKLVQKPQLSVGRPILIQAPFTM